MRPEPDDTPSSHRTYVAADGRPWKVWEVKTSFAERRLSERRGGSGTTKPAAGERRSGSERRKRREVRAPARPGFENGWLAFESPDETRRLGPVPPRWETMTDAELEALCRRALSSRTRRRRLIE